MGSPEVKTVVGEWFHEELDAIRQIVESGQRVTRDQGLFLYEKAPLGYLGTLADLVRQRMHGRTTYFNRNYHLEPTNYCVFSCDFCSYSRKLREKQGQDIWHYSMEEMLEKVGQYPEDSVTEVHIVGGVHPHLDMAYYLKFIAAIKALRPGIHVKALTAVEYAYIFKKAKLSYHEGFRQLIDAGLGSLPGGGAEIFDPEIRKQICADKCTGQEWLDIHRAAHECGLKSNATILYGHMEEYRHRVDHMDRLRELQDQTGGFQCFIPLKFRNKDNEMSHIPETSVIEDLRNYAVSRIYLDNFDHIKAYWPMIGRWTAQLSLSFGVNDLDGTIDDTTKIYSLAGAEEQNPSMTSAQIRELIQATGHVPQERDSLYHVVDTTVDS